MSRLKLSAICLMVVAMSLQSAYALSFVVSSTAASGPGSLYQAVVDANATSGSSITFAPALAGQTIVLGSALPDLTGGNTTISGDINGDGRPDVMVNGRDSLNSAFIIRSSGNVT
ncbi:MAG: hypothetical protein ACYC63_00400 [Armatimonadota bacterium]